MENGEIQVSKIAAHADYRAKRRAKNAKVLAKINAKSSEPIVEENDKSALGNALSTYSRDTTSADQKKFAVEYFKTVDPTIAEKLETLEDYNFGTFGSVCRLKHRGQWVDPTSDFFPRRLKELIESADKKATEVKAKPVVADKVKKVLTAEERYKAEANKILGDLEEEEELIMGYGYPKYACSKVNTKGIKTARPQVAKLIREWIEPRLNEMKEALAGTCEQLNEGYSHMDAKQKKNYISWLELAMGMAKTSEKAEYRIRVRKPQKPEKIVQRFKYLKEHAELKLTSEEPKLLVEATQIMLYNTKTRVADLYVAAEGKALSVKGTSIINYDATKSLRKVVRKPEELTNLGKGKVTLRNWIDSLTTKQYECNGRSSADTIIFSTTRM
jgi:hypothetical protein